MSLNEIVMSRGKKPVAPSSDSSDEDTADILDLEDDEGWEDAEPDEDEEALHIVSLLDDRRFADVESMLAHCKNEHAFDFLQLRDALALDFYGTIKLVNYIRSRIKAHEAVGMSIGRDDIQDDVYLQPVLGDDAFLFSLDELPSTHGPARDAAEASGGCGAVENSQKLLAQISELEEELRRVQGQFSEYRATVKQTLDERWNENNSALSDAKPAPRDDDSHYFSSYSYNDIHETMLKDTVRTDAYRDFIYNHKNLFAGKIVLDVGCGTGILSLFCAKAGAARVIAVDNSAIIDKARENVFNNGFADKIVCLRGKVEEVSLPVEKVDIIVSEWMGYCLLYEAMLDSVIWARDRYLRPDGLMVPSHMNMWVAPVADPDYVTDHIAFWRDVYGFDMKAMQAGIHEDAQVLHMPTNTICGGPQPLMQLELHTTTVKDLTFKSKWKTTLSKDIDELDGLIIWFDTFFVPSRHDRVPSDAHAKAWAEKEERGVAFTTGPEGKETHWRQGVLLIDHGDKKASGYAKNTPINGEIEYSVPSDNSRALDVRASWAVGSDKERTQVWKMR